MSLAIYDGFQFRINNRLNHLNFGGGVIASHLYISLILTKIQLLQYLEKSFRTELDRIGEKEEVLTKRSSHPTSRDTSDPHRSLDSKCNLDLPSSV